MNLLEGWRRGRRGTGRLDCFLFPFLFPPGTERVESKTWRCFGKGREGAGASLLHPFSFPFPFSFSFCFLFPFYVFSVFLRNETKRTEPNRNEAMRELFFFYDRFGDVSQKKIQIIFI